jgi:DNA-binding NarL/FixJ family response regulator
LFYSKKWSSKVMMSPARPVRFSPPSSAPDPRGGIALSAAGGRLRNEYRIFARAACDTGSEYLHGALHTAADIGRQRALKIAVVDDHPLIREALRKVLQVLDNDVQLFEARNRDEAIQAVVDQPDLDLVLLDLTLPGTDGLAVLQELRAQHPNVPVVVLSATDAPEVVMRAIDAGAMGFIPKTSSSQLLVQALRLVLAGGVYLPLEVLRKDDGTPGDSQSSEAPLRSPRDIGLTERQAQVLALMVQGKPNKLICRDLALAEGTVKIHITAILKALNVANRTQAVVAVSKLRLKLPTA